MTKQAFLEVLCRHLAVLPPEDVEEHAVFYGEMIDDRIEDGASEEDAVAAMGDACAVAQQIVADASFAKLIRHRIRTHRRISAVEIVLLVLGSPVWLSIFIALLAVALSLYASLWAVIVSLWAVFASVAASAVGGVVGGTLLAVSEHTWQGLVLVGCALVCGGLSVLLFYGCKAATKGAAWLTKVLVRGTKRLFMKKGDAA